MGIPYDLFWKLNPRKLKPFRKAEEMKIEASQARLNLTAWISGIYIQHAIASCFGKNNKYPKEPIDFFQKKEKLTPEQEAANFAAYVEQFAMRRKKNEAASGKR